MGIETAILGSAALGAGAGLLGSRSASRAQTRAADQAAATQREMFERQVELQAPFREAGLTAQNRLMTLLGLGGDPNAAGYGSAARDFSMADYTADPGYGFRMSEGMKAIERSSAARGGLLSGATLKGVQRFGQDLASAEYGNAYNRFYQMRNAQLNPLQAFLGQGQTSTNVLTGAAGDVGRGVAAAQQGAGAARASGYVGGANALTGALQSAVPNYMMYNFLNQGRSGMGAGPANVMEGVY